MDYAAFIIIAVSIVLWFVTKKKPFFLLTLGVGIGLLIGAIWAVAIVNSVVR